MPIDKYCQRDLKKIFTDLGYPIHEPMYCSEFAGLIDMGLYNSPFFKMVENYYRGYSEETIVYRFRKAEFAISELTNRKLRAYNLLSQFDNDFAEASEFYLRARTLKLLCSSADSQSPDSIESVRDNVHILCFSKSPSEQLWKEYGDNKGCCLVFKAKYQPTEFSRFADVLYGADDLFDKMNLIQSDVKRRFRKVLFLPGISYFSLLYKRTKYTWEDEIRFVFQPSKLGCKVISTEVHNKWDMPEIQKYCEIPFNEHSTLPIHLELHDVILGQEIDENHKHQIEALKKQILSI